MPVVQKEYIHTFTYKHEKNNIIELHRNIQIEQFWRFPNTKIEETSNVKYIFQSNKF